MSTLKADQDKWLLSYEFTSSEMIFLTHNWIPNQASVSTHARKDALLYSSNIKLSSGLVLIIPAPSRFC